MQERDQNTIERLRYLAQPEKQLVFQARSFIFQRTRHFLSDNGFVEVHLPSVATISTDPVPDPSKELFSVKWYEEQAYLVQSAQLHKQMLMATGFSQIYSLAPFWRAEEVMTPRHLSEAWSLDIEMAHISSEEDVMGVLEGLLPDLVEQTRLRYQNRLNITESITTPIERLSYDQTIQILQQDGAKIDWGEDLGYDREKRLGEIMKSHGIDIFFITHYPAKVKKFYTKLKEDPEYTGTFDLIWHGWEIASGAQRETNLDVLTKRIREKNLDLEDYEDFLDIFRFGVPEHGGCGVGMDRIVAKVLGLDSVRDVVLFPRSKNQLRP